MRIRIDPSQVEFASFPQRIAARIFDQALVFGLFYLFVRLSGESLVFNPEKPDPYFGVGKLMWFLPLFAVAYEVPTMASRGATLGKRLMGLCVVRTDGLIGIGLDRALIRYLTPLACALIPFVGLFTFVGAQAWFIFDDKRQNIADKAARTYVVRVPRINEVIQPPTDDVIDI